MATILVTGATGFIGGAIAKKLVELGHEVRILRRKNAKLLLLKDLKVTHCIGDLNDRDSICQAMAGCEQVYHAAAFISFWKKEEPLQYQINVEGTRNMVDAALETGVQRFLFTSSVSALGYPEPDGYVGDEDTLYNWGKRESGYNRTKHLAELEVLKGVDKGLAAVILNPGTVFGPGDINFNGGAYIRAVKQGSLLFYPPGGTTVVDIDMVVQGHLAAAEMGRIGERYILGGQLMTYREMFEIIARVTGGRPPRFEIPKFVLQSIGSFSEILGTLTRQRPLLTSQMALHSTMRLYYSSDKAQKELNLPTIPFRVSIEKAWQWYREKGLL